MKKINSIGYAHKIIGLLGLFLVIIPLCLYILNFLFNTTLFTVPIYISFIIGFLILLFFIILLSVEFKQDKKIDRKYITVKKTKIKLVNGLYECQSCGSRKVSITDKNCSICGTTFNIEKSKII